MTGQQVLFRIASLLVIASTHGFTVALLARLMGDPGPTYDGRRTFDPLSHIEPIGAVAMVLLRVGWLKPMAIDPALIRGRMAGLLVIVLGSLLATVALAEFLWALRPWILTTFTGSSAVLTSVLLIENFATLSLAFAVLNLIPLPPFTAGILLAGIAPGLHKRMVGRIIIPALVAGALLLAADAAGWLDRAIAAIARALLP